MPFLTVLTAAIVSLPATIPSTTYADALPSRETDNDPSVLLIRIWYLSNSVLSVGVLSSRRDEDGVRRR